MHRKGLILAVLLFILSTVQTYAFTPDNALLTTMYDKIDLIYTQQPDRLLKIYQKLPELTIRYVRNMTTKYYLNKIATYIHGKLFTFDQQPHFVCLDQRVQKGDTVEINYTMKTSGERLLVTTRDDVAQQYGWKSNEVSNLLAFNPGYGQVIKGVDQTVLGTKLGQRIGKILSPRDAYGTYQADLLIQFAGNALPIELTLVKKGETVALSLLIEGEEKLLVGTVVTQNQELVIVDFNHPLADQTIQLTLQPVNLFKGCSSRKL